MQLPLSKDQNNYITKGYSNFMSKNLPGFETVREKCFKTIADWKLDLRSSTDSSSSNNESIKKELNPIYDNS